MESHHDVTQKEKVTEKFNLDLFLRQGLPVDQPGLELLKILLPLLPDGPTTSG